MKKSTKSLIGFVLMAVWTITLIGAIAFYRESGILSNGYQTFNITGPLATVVILGTVVFCIAGAVFTFVKWNQYGQKLVSSK